MDEFVHLASLYAPVVYINDTEDFYPCSIEYILKKSDLVQGFETKKDSPLNVSDLEKFSVDNNGEKTVIRVKYSACIGQYNLEEDPAPMYVTYYKSPKGNIVFQYLFLFSFNGKESGQIRHFSVEVENHGEKKIVACFYNTYNDGGMWVKPHNVLFLNTHPVVYCSRRTHGLFPKNSTYRRRFGYIKDTCSLGVRWCPKRLIEINDKTPWVNFPGTMGNLTGCTMPCRRKWWRKEYYSPLRNYWVDLFRRIFS